MNVLLIFFLKYLLAPVLIIIATLLLSIIAKGQAVLKMKKLIIFILVSALILMLPSLLGLLKYEFIWGGIIISMSSYLLFGVLFNWFSHSKVFITIGFKEDNWSIILALLIVVILGAWGYYFIFSWINTLGYAVWAMTTVVWFLVPPLYVFARSIFLQIPSPFYKLWMVNNDINDDEYWNNIDVFRLMQVTVKIKRAPNIKQYSSFSVKVPKDIALGRWFNRFINDQNIKFPNNIIELEGENGAYGWILYTNRWLPIPLFTRTLDFDEDFIQNKLKNKATLYIRRVSKNNEDSTDTDTEGTES